MLIGMEDPAIFLPVVKIPAEVTALLTQLQFHQH